MIFRYPGGKGKLIKRFLKYIPAADCFSDVFVGGGSVALAVAAQKGNETTRIYLNDFDYWISSFWNIVIGDELSFKLLITAIESVKITVEEFKKRRDLYMPEDFSCRGVAGIVDAAFNALFFNRTTFSGCLSSGPIGGYDQRGDWKIDARWNSERLIKEINLARKLLQGRTEVTNLDFTKAIEKLPLDCFIYADPPYYRKGGALYGPRFAQERHSELFNILEKRNKWLLSSDNCSEIKDLYAGFVQKSLGKKFRSMSSQSERPEDDSERIIFSKEETMKRTKETYIDEEGVERYVGTKNKARSSKKNLKSSILEPLLAPEVAITDEKILFDFLNPAQCRALIISEKCEITLSQARQVIK